jgi:hypothetical protein
MIRRDSEQEVFSRVYAIPTEHGVWALWISPFLAGWGVASENSLGLLWTFLAIFFLFMARHPLLILVRALSGHRKSEDARPAAVWVGLYSITAGGFAILLIAADLASLLLLALPAIPFLAWQLVAVARRQERQMPLEIAGSGVLALAAPAAHVAASGTWTDTAFWLWILTWLYSIVSIVYVYLRLQQRQLKSSPDSTARFRMGKAAMRTAAAALLLVALLTIARQVPRFAPLPFVFAQLHVFWGAMAPAVGARPQRVGYAQVGAYAVFTLLLIVAYTL